MSSSTYRIGDRVNVDICLGGHHRLNKCKCILSSSLGDEEDEDINIHIIKRGEVISMDYTLEGEMAYYIKLDDQKRSIGVLLEAIVGLPVKIKK